MVEDPFSTVLLPVQPCVTCSLSRSLPAAPQLPEIREHGGSQNNTSSCSILQTGSRHPCSQSNKVKPRSAQEALPQQSNHLPAVLLQVLLLASQVPAGCLLWTLGADAQRCQLPTPNPH